MKKIILSLVCLLVLVTGCSNDDKRSSIKSNNIDQSKYKTTGYKYVKCNRATETNNGETVTVKYEVFYDNDKNVQVLKSYEKVESDDSSILTQYQNAYKNIYAAYDGLDYYDNTITNDSKSVTSITYINYGKINIDKLMDIEGSEDNVTVTNGKIKLSDWKNFAKKYGTVCKNS